MTLLEMVVVLAILVAATTLAIRVTSGLINETKYDVTKRALDAYRTAVIGTPAPVGSGAAPQVSSFAADLGRLPKAVLVGTNLTLGELLSQGSNPTYGFYTAATANTLGVNDPNPPVNPPATSGTLTPNVWLSTAPVRVASGWRGPYIYANPSQGGLVDGWGKTIAAYSGTTNSPVQFLQYVMSGGNPTTAFTVATSAGAQVAGLVVAGGASLGAGVNAGNDPYLATQYSLINLNELTAQAIVQITISGSVATPVNLPPQPNRWVDVRVFEANPNADSTPTIPIRCVARRVTYESTALSVAFTTPFVIGPKVVLCEVVAANGAASGYTTITTPTAVYFQPGINFVRANIYVN